MKLPIHILCDTGKRLLVVRLLSLVAVLFTVTFISLQSQANGLQRTLGSQVTVKPSRSAFALIANGKPAPLVY